jgi:hypothetical protein
MSVKLDRSLLHLRNLRLPLCQIGGRASAHVDLIDTHDESVIDVVDSPRSLMTGPSGLCDCVTTSYAARPVSRQDVNKLRIDDSKCATVACECEIAVTKRHPGDATLKSKHTKSQERGVAS